MADFGDYAAGDSVWVGAVSGVNVMSAQSRTNANDFGEADASGIFSRYEESIDLIEQVILFLRPNDVFGLFRFMSGIHRHLSHVQHCCKPSHQHAQPQG